MTYVSANEFAERLGIEYATFRMWRSRGRVPPETVKSGNRPLWTREVVDAFVAKVATDPSFARRSSGGRCQPRFTRLT